MGALKRQFHCLYCGEPSKRGRRGEHIVPEAIGGALTLLDVSDIVVCTKCNTGFLSQLDKELCSRSYLSAVASQQIAAHLWQAWDLDRQSENLLVEARPSWAPDGTMNSLICYPQITLERSGVHIRSDADEFRQFGVSDFAKVLFKAVRRSFDRYRYGEKSALHFERIDSGVIPTGCRLAPRVFTRHSIYEIARKVSDQSFILRFCNEEDKRFALRSLASLSDSREITNWGNTPGCRRPTISYSFDVALTLRALIKLGLNLVAAHCQTTPVNRESFAQAMRIVRGEMQFKKGVMAANGFVHAEDVADIKAGSNDHGFRLVHLDDTWHIFSSFFGGKIGSYVQFPGPSQEEWRSAVIVAPLRSKEWSFSPSPILAAKKVRVSWQGSSSVTPSLKLRDTLSSLVVSVMQQERSPHGAKA